MSESISVKHVGNKALGFEAEFRRVEDRHHHAIFLLDGDHRTELLVSVEGTPADVWPPSPPLQQVYRQTIGNDPVILGVGMAGKSHYSTSLIVRDSDTPIIIVESACLAKGSESRAELQTTYRVAKEIQYQLLGDGVKMAFRNHQIVLKPLANSVCQRLENQAITFAPESMHAEKTVQWGYELVLV